MIKSKLTVIFLLFYVCACNTIQEKDDYSDVLSKKYETDFIKKYSKYHIGAINIENGDYIKNYTSLCKIENCSKTNDYEIVQSYQIYTTKDSIYDSTFNFELLHFKDRKKVDTIIKEIKTKNCIDEITLKIHRIYRIGANTIICVNYSSFDIVEYENFLMREFNKLLTIEVINASY